MAVKQGAQVFKNIGIKEFIWPGDIVELGDLTFICERFNTGVSTDIGGRMKQEDTHVMIQDL